MVSKIKGGLQEEIEFFTLLLMKKTNEYEK